jgi:hypothetical protein
MKERNANKTHQQRFQGRHDQPLPPPVDTERNEAPFGPDRDGAAGRPPNEEGVPGPDGGELRGDPGDRTPSK